MRLCSTTRRPFLECEVFCNGSDTIKKALHDAQVVIRAGQGQGLLPASNSLAEEALAMVRLEMLSQALAFSRHGQWIRDSAERPDWEYAQVFGHLTRLAKFEISQSPDGGSWRHFLSLFRLYFGSGIDKLAPSIFLAAVFHPDTILSATVLADVEAIVRSVEVEAVASDSMADMGMFG